MKFPVLAFCFISYLNVFTASTRVVNVSELMKIIDRSHPAFLRLTFKTLPSSLRQDKHSVKPKSKPPQDDDNPVYGNIKNLGITYDKTTSRLLYSGFRRGNYIWATFLNNKTEKNDRKKGSAVVVIRPKSKPKKYKLRDTIFKYLDYLKNMDDSVESRNDLTSYTVKENKLDKKIQDLLDSKGQIEFNVVNKNENLDKNTEVKIPVFKTNDELLKERSKSIQDFLNSHMPVFNTKPRIEDTSAERKAQVEDFLNYHIPGGREKLSLDEKTQHIQDFLNKKSPIFLDVNYAKDSKGYYGDISTGKNLINEDENNANEIVDQYSSESSEETDGVWKPNYRRASHKKKKKHRDRDSKYEDKDVESEESASSDYDKNPGNPFTVHKNKYKKNWLWNHFMDGDHMNINPFGPLFANMGPSGADLFFGRKWWYYNQDDYKPLG